MFIFILITLAIISGVAFRNMTIGLLILGLPALLAVLGLMVVAYTLNGPTGLTIAALVAGGGAIILGGGALLIERNLN